MTERERARDSLISALTRAVFGDPGTGSAPADVEDALTVLEAPPAPAPRKARPAPKPKPPAAKRKGTR